MELIIVGQDSDINKLAGLSPPSLLFSKKKYIKIKVSLGILITFCKTIGLKCFGFFFTFVKSNITPPSVCIFTHNSYEKKYPEWYEVKAEADFFLTQTIVDSGLESLHLACIWEYFIQACLYQ